MSDEAEEMIRRENLAKRAPIGGLFASSPIRSAEDERARVREVATGIAWPAPSVPAPGSERAADALTHTASGRSRRETLLVHLLRIIASTEAGATADELDEDTRLGSGTICPRIDELRTAGYIDSSDTIMRTTRKGRGAAVHFVTAKGRAFLAAKAAA